MGWIIGKIFELFSKRKISQRNWFFLLFGALLPDADHLIDWTLGLDIHRTFTHSIFFSIIAGMILYLVLNRKDYSIALSVGILIHLVSDMISPFGIPAFWPSMMHLSFTYFGPLPSAGSLFTQEAAGLMSSLKLAIVDMGVGAAGFLWLLYKGKVKL